MNCATIITVEEFFMAEITREEIEDGMILFCKSGSHAYGLNTENSDLDYKGICIAPKRFYITFKTFEQKDKGWEVESSEDSLFPQLDNSDSVVYDIRRYLALLQSQNPNILEMLWQDPEDYIFLTDLSKTLIDNKKKLLSKRISGTFIQYARAQIKKMETHRKWLLNPPTKRPEWEDYGVPTSCLTSTQIEAFIEYLYLLIKDRIEYYQPSIELYQILNEKVDWKGVLKQSVLPEECVEMSQQITRASEEYMVLLRSSQQYRADLKRWSNYQDWLVNRNAKRSEIERICGYDGKNASHCVRLMKMAIEGLRTGELIVNRKKAGDASLLLDIKLGRLSYEEVHTMVNELFSEAEYVLHNECVLPDRIDYDFVNSLCEEIVEKSGILQ
jgi:predicted nucleotidyltransferase